MKITKGCEKMDAAINNEFESTKQDSNAEFVAKLARDGVMKKWRQGLIKELKEIGHSATYAKFASSKITVNFEITEQDKDEVVFALNAGLSNKEAVDFLTMEFDSMEEKLKATLDKREAIRILKIKEDERLELERIAEEERRADEERKAHRYQEDCLTGTDKQIAWAKDIRKSIVQAHGGTSDNERDEFLKVCKKIKRSKFWIDHRHLEHKLQPPGVDVKAYIIECSKKVMN